MSSIYRSLSFSFLERLILVGVTLASYVAIARLLTPEEIGIYSISAALISIGQVVREFGIGNYLIQEKNLTKAHIQTAFGVSFLIGGTLFFAFALGAPLAGSFYNDERMTWIVRIIAINFLIMPFCSISLSLLRREMLFYRLMLVNIFAAIIGTTVTVYLAFNDFGPQSLAWGAIAVNISTGFSAWVARSSNKLLLPSLTEWRTVVAFGSQSAGVAVITTVAMDINDLVVGRVLGFGPTAIISRANGLVALFNQQVMGAIKSVALPAFARAHRENKPLEPIYVSSVTAVTAIAWPFYGFIALYATDILRIMFGTQWDAAAPLVPIICGAGAITAIYSLALTLAIAIGRNNIAVKTDLILQPIKATILIATALIFKSLEAIAWATLLVNTLSAPYFLRVKNNLLTTDTSETWNGLKASAILSIACLSIPTINVMFIAANGISGIKVTLIMATITIFTWIIGLFWLKHPLSNDAFVVKIKSVLLANIPLFKILFPRNY